MKIALVAGESSGDVLGAGLIRAIRRRFPDAKFEGVAGPLMLAAGCEQWEASESLAVMGIVEPLAHIPRLLKLRKSLVKRWLDAPPDVFVGIDAPDFNLGLEKKLRRGGIKTVHYVSPSIWAWRAGRIKTIKAAVDKVLCLLPFEKTLYDQHGVAAEFVGHPRADEISTDVDCEVARQSLNLTASEVVAIMPGSRHGEVSRLGETLYEAARQIAEQRHDVQFVTPAATPALRPIIEAQISAAGLQEKCVVLDQQSEQAMRAADVVLLASGTAALESALLTKPTVAAYKVATLSYAIVVGLGLVKLSHYTLPNLLIDPPLIPEFIQGNAKPELIAQAVCQLLDDPQRRQIIATRFAKLREELAQDSDQRAADAVIALAEESLAT